MAKSGLIPQLLAATCIALHAISPAAGAPTPESLPAPMPSTQSQVLTAAPRYVGTGSCTAAGCHAGEYRGRPSHGDPWSPVAYNLWLSHDRHAQAYQTLLSAESQELAAKLGFRNAHQQPECLACHAPEGATDHFTVSHRSTVVDGVGCESCHGAAERWLAPHKTDGWLFTSLETKESLGFRNLDDLSTRASTCSRCHVGSAGRDVNHDLIAAGHPRLTFEMSSLHSRMAKHWRDEDQPEQTLDAKLWVVGRAAAAQASVALLETRAKHAAPWPEFSEYDCYACHHSLRDAGDSGRSILLGGQRKPGSLRWNEGSFAMLKLVGLESGQDSHLESLASEMSRPLPDRQRVAYWAGSAGRVLHANTQELSRRSITSAEVQQYLRALSSNPQAGAASWDRASDRFLGLAAMHYSSVALAGRAHSLPGSAAGVRRQHLVSLRSLLRFPRTGQGAVTNSPPSWDEKRRAEVEQSFRQIYSTLP